MGPSFEDGLFFCGAASMLGCMTGALIIRTARLSDMAAVDTLLARSYPRLLAADYPPSVMVLALPIISRARPELLASGQYFLAFGADGKLLGAGGWSAGAPGPSDQPAGQAGPARTGHVRHVATDPAAVRQGVGRAVMAAVFAAAKAAGVTAMDCLSTRTAVPFYKSIGFQVIGPIEVPLRAGIVFPAVQMICDEI
jgi:GNAT superfamily N-acetyltransferase